jgi:(2S)-methylsuccinyl-CoA dehydrogenase
MRQMQNWATKLTEAGEFGEAEQLLHQIACGEYHAQVVGGIPMSQGEIVRLSDIKISTATQREYQNAAVMNLIANGNTQTARTRLVELMQEQAGNVIFDQY